ncbi:uncharacterized protein [Dermacentor andersoni]|uniref:uncharacterized protein n=1 Tax=Dermacentor andersoni TaxID=34620 RepID=UPI002416F2BD|nr:uncharacterized protein LOC129384904 [Dermacentor andersoni]
MREKAARTAAVARPRRGGGLFLRAVGLRSSTERPTARNPFAPPREPLAAAAAGSRRRGARATRPWPGAADQPSREGSEHTAVWAVLCAGGGIVSVLPALCSVCCALCEERVWYALHAVAAAAAATQRATRAEAAAPPCGAASLCRTACCKRNNIGYTHILEALTCSFLHSRSGHVVGSSPFWNSACSPAVHGPAHCESSTNVGTLQTGPKGDVLSQCYNSMGNKSVPPTARGELPSPPTRTVRRVNVAFLCAPEVR